MHRFRDIAFDMSNVAIFSVLPPSEGFPWDDLRKISHDGLYMARLQNSVETLRKISTGLVRSTNVTDDRQTKLQRQIPERNVVTHVRVKIQRGKITSPVVFVILNSKWVRVVITDQYTMGSSISRQFSQNSSISIVQFLTSSVYCQSVIRSCTS